LERAGEIWVSLVKGQGGTPVDKPRAWGDTWQVTACAATAGLVMRKIAAFTPPPGYRAGGYKSLNKGFYLEGSLRHIFVRAPPTQPKRDPQRDPAGGRRRPRRMTLRGACALLRAGARRPGRCCFTPAPVGSRHVFLDTARLRRGLVSRFCVAHARGGISRPI
jgi:hypothetical protein